MKYINAISDVIIIPAKPKSAQYLYSGIGTASTCAIRLEPEEREVIPEYVLAANS